MNAALDSIYRRLYVFFGPQHWWPAESPFEVMVGAILTQNTSWSNVEKAINSLKKNGLLELTKLSNLPERRLALLIKSAGYYNIKAKRLKVFLRFLCGAYAGDIRRMALEDTENLRPRLLSLNGIGPETADSILLYALDKPVFVVDSYTKRILFRHRLVEEDASYSEVQDLFMQNDKFHRKKISYVVKLFNEYHALLVRLGKEFCLKNKPKCDICPLK